MINNIKIKSAFSKVKNDLNVIWKHTSKLENDIRFVNERVDFIEAINNTSYDDRIQKIEENQEKLSRMLNNILEVLNDEQDVNLLDQHELVPEIPAFNTRY